MKILLIPALTFSAMLAGAQPATQNAPQTERRQNQAPRECKVYTLPMSSEYDGNVPLYRYYLARQLGSGSTQYFSITSIKWNLKLSELQEMVANFEAGQRPSGGQPSGNEPQTANGGSAQQFPVSIVYAPLNEQDFMVNPKLGTQNGQENGPNIKRLHNIQNKLAGCTIAAGPTQAQPQHTAPAPSPAPAVPDASDEGSAGAR